MKTIKPILKWAGGKRQLLSTINNLKPTQFNRYIEPFCGGAAVFFDLEPTHAIIGDKNKDLINCYKQIKSNLKYLKRELNHHTKYHSETYYYEMRKRFNNRRKTQKTLNSVDAALMIYLNKAGFNGMFRENALGEFNVPSGKKESVILYENENLNRCAEQLQQTEIIHADFIETAQRAEAGDFVFFDSPYDNTFHQYQADGFKKEDHERLAQLFWDLTNRGVFCMLTNSDTEFIRNLYTNEQFTIRTEEVRRMISSHAEKPFATELIITNYSN